MVSHYLKRNSTGKQLIYNIVLVGQSLLIQANCRRDQSELVRNLNSRLMCEKACWVVCDE